MRDLTPVMISAITCLFAAITVFVIPFLRQKLSIEKREELMKWTEIAVNAAEQLCKSGVISKEDRKNHVLAFLNNKGYDVNLEEIDELIQSFVVNLPPLVIKKNDDG